ncbi:putative leucine-rich repeat domain, L domain-containing protein [Rosa chinensis]|uniref:Putative leucine-rich repeat domain, L domain-containing protein n=1 Tax=Rosa chinensis TaxID=74649 RepID=A0A2P6RNP7_ROSCH|nr:putative leucine-rich repeat domain, L domain-containing protein [Rosa chinensis]
MWGPLSVKINSGSVPDLKDLALLEEINFGNNHIGPAFPLLGNNLVSLILSNNSMRFEIPKMMRLPTLGLPPYHVFTLEEIEDATNNFDDSNLLGERS